MGEDKELDEIRKKRLLELQNQMNSEQQQVDAASQLESQKQAFLRRILTPEARQRLANLKMVRAQFAAQLEVQLIQIAQQGRMRLPIDDNQLREILIRLQTKRREIKIRRV